MSSHSGVYIKKEDNPFVYVAHIWLGLFEKILSVV